MPSEPVGTLEGRLSVSPDGAAAYALPLIVPTGRAGIQPELVLAYSSRAGNGPLGVGWSLSGVSQITRCGSTKARDGLVRPVEYSANDHFCLDGKRLALLSGVQGGAGEYRTEPDSHAKIEGVGGAPGALGPDRFEIRTKDGRILTYGSTSDSRVDAQSIDAATGALDPSPRRVAWLLAKVEAAPATT